jgi:hypothetical protein
MIGQTISTYHVVEKMLQKNPDDRYQSMGEVVEALGGTRGEPISGGLVQPETAGRRIIKPLNIGVW